ncbi:MAG TPA: universal stress protein [Ktedonobacteraceae bacterium]|nr:universal stress protein [Ktedonobacteraceae bacterium]
MYKRILVPLDGSTRAESAVPIAARIAQASGGSVILLQVVSIPIEIETEKPPSEIYSQPAYDKGIADTKSYLEGVATFDVLKEVNKETAAVTGAIAPSILSAIQSLHADLVVMCSHGFTGFKHWALGSVAHKLAPHSSVPVLVLRDGGSVPTTESQQPMRVFVPLDGSPLSESALEPAAQLITALAPSTHRVIHLMRVVDVPSSYGKFRSLVDDRYDAGVRAETKNEYKAYLDAVAKRFTEGDLAAYKLAVTTSVPINMDVAQAIVQAAEEGEGSELSGYDLVVMATHGRGGVQRWVLGSVAERVLQATKVPLMIVHSFPVKHEHHQETQAEAQHSHTGV